MHRHVLVEFCPLQRDKDRGFSLAEVLVSVALLSIIVLALFGLVTAGIQRTYGGRKMTQAAVIAQDAMERANVYAPQDLLYDATNAGTYTTLSTLTQTWSRVGSSVTPAAPPSGTAENVVQQTAWRNLLATADLPSYTGKPAVLTITAEAIPPTSSFATAKFVRVTVDVQWHEYAKRARRVRLQSI